MFYRSGGTQQMPLCGLSPRWIWRRAAAVVWVWGMEGRAAAVAWGLAMEGLERAAVAVARAALTSVELAMVAAAGEAKAVDCMTRKGCSLIICGGTRVM